MGEIGLRWLSAGEYDYKIPEKHLTLAGSTGFSGFFLSDESFLEMLYL